MEPLGHEDVAGEGEEGGNPDEILDEYEPGAYEDGYEYGI